LAADEHDREPDQRTAISAAKHLAWKMRPDDKVLGWDMKIM